MKPKGAATVTHDTRSLTAVGDTGGSFKSPPHGVAGDTPNPDLQNPMKVPPLFEEYYSLKVNVVSLRRLKGTMVLVLFGDTHELYPEVGVPRPRCH